MPDIKTALEQALAKAQTIAHAQLPADWDDEGGAAVIESVTTQAKEATMRKNLFTATNNVTRATFDYVLKNPGKTRKEIIKALEAQGYKEGSTSSLIGQFTKQGQFVHRGKFLFTVNQEYKALKTTRAPKEKPVPVQKAKATPRPEIVPVAKAVPAPAPAPQINAAWDAATLLNNLSIKQARALYDELRTIFGG